MRKIICYELEKIFLRRLTQTALLILLLLSLLLSFSSYRNTYAWDPVTGDEGSGRKGIEVEKAVAERYGGTLTDETVQKMISEMVPKTGPDEINAMYLYRNTLQYATGMRFCDANGNWNGRRVSDVFGKEEIRIGYTIGWYQTSQNLTILYVLLSFLVILMIAPVFSGEYESGVDSLILTTRCGKTKCAIAKAAAGLLAAFLVTAFITCINIAVTFLLYGGGGLDCSVLFLPEEYLDAYIPYHLTWAASFIWQVLLAFTGILGVTRVTLILSAACKNSIAAFAACAVIHVLPVIVPVAESSPLFRLLVLLPLYHLQFVSIMSVEKIVGNILYAVLAVPVAVVLMGSGVIASQKIFARHQVY